MNYSDYANKKEKNIISIIEVGGGYAFKIKRFDQETGIELPSELEAIDEQEIINEKEKLINSINDINNILSDINNMKI